MNQFEKLIEYIINEQEDKARELFHQIVVEKSRSIYENLIDEEPAIQQSGSGVDNLVDEISDDEHGMHEEEEENPFGNDEEGAEHEEGESDEEEGAEHEEGGSEMDGEMGGEQELSDRVMDLEAELDALSAKFDRIVAGEENEEHGEPGIHGDVSMHDMGGMGGDEHSMMDTDELMEYVIPVKDGHGAEKKSAPEGKLVGNDGSAPINSKSLNQPKNNMGGTSGNIVKGGSESAPEGRAYSMPKNEYSKNSGQIDVTKRQVNVPGGKGADKFYNGKETSYEKNHGKEGQTTDGSVPVVKSSVVAESRRAVRKTTR